LGETDFYSASVPVTSRINGYEGYSLGKWYDQMKYLAELGFISRPKEAPLWSSGSVLDHRSLPSMFESWRGHI